MTTSTITWHRPTDQLPDADTSVLVGLHLDGLRTTSMGFVDDGEWRDCDGMPIPDGLVAWWAELPECPL